MEEFPEGQEPSKVIWRRTLSEEERRNLLEKRIKELRKRKRAEKRASRGRPVRILLPILLISFFLLCLLSSLIVWGQRGGNQGYLYFELPASNLEQIAGLAKGKGEVTAPDIEAAAAYLLDPLTGDVLYEKNADQPLAMASTTKVMTAIVVMENASLTDSVTVSEYADATGESSAWLEKGEVLTVEQLLYALLLQSANDAAVALAESIAGSEEAFVEMMNAKARELGLENTSFANPHGLDEAGHYTSARDLAMTAAYAMRNPLFRQIVATDSYQIPWAGHPSPRVLENHNKLLDMYPYATGIKTGYTNGSGLCLVASAQKEDRELISVILNGGESYWDQTIRLMDYGFNDFARVEYAFAGKALTTVEVGDFPRRETGAAPEQDMLFTVRADYLEGFEAADVFYQEWVPYPVEKGQEVGYLVAGEGTPQERREPLASQNGLDEPGFFTRVAAFIVSILALWWSWIKWLIPGL